MNVESGFSLSPCCGIRNLLITLIPSRGVAIRSFLASLADRFCSIYLSISYRHHHHQQHAPLTTSTTS